MFPTLFLSIMPLPDADILQGYFVFWYFTTSQLVQKNITSNNKSSKKEANN